MSVQTSQSMVKHWNRLPSAVQCPIPASV